jgi:hypothetical protein
MGRGSVSGRSSPAVGPSKALGPQHLKISAERQPGSSMRYAPPRARVAGIVMPRCNSEAISVHLEEIAFHVAPGAHAVRIIDQAGWRLCRTGRARQYHSHAAATPVPRSDPRRECLAAHAR